MAFQGKVALVTGSGRNIGRATVLELARQGADVVVNARSNSIEAEAVAEEARALGVQAMPILADVGDISQLERMMSAITDKFGRIDILVNNAGLRRTTAIADLSIGEWREVMAVNLEAPFLLCKSVIPGMIALGGGRIINVSGLNAFKGSPGWSHVSASKMGALGLTRALAMELAAYGILVNHIVPGAFDTIREVAEDQPQAADRPVGIPLGRLGMPEEIGRICAFLASDDASFITGQTIHVNGGAFTY